MSEDLESVDADRSGHIVEVVRRQPEVRHQVSRDEVAVMVAIVEHELGRRLELRLVGESRDLLGHARIDLEQHESLDGQGRCDTRSGSPGEQRGRKCLHAQLDILEAFILGVCYF